MLNTQLKTTKGFDIERANSPFLEFQGHLRNKEMTVTWKNQKIADGNSP